MLSGNSIKQNECKYRITVGRTIGARNILNDS